MVERVKAFIYIHLPLVDRVEVLKTHIYPLYVQFATIMLGVDGVGEFFLGGATWYMNNMANNLQPHETHTLCSGRH